MKLRTALAVIGDIRHTYLTPHVGKLFAPDRADLFFSEGWGEDERIARLAARGAAPVTADIPAIDWQAWETSGGIRKRAGSFPSPFPGELLAEESRTAHVELHLPENADATTPIFILFAMTGDQGFRRRARSYARPLAQRGIGTLLLENPYYGARRPAYQKSFMLASVADILAMCLAAVEEGLALIQHLRAQGYRRIGVGGVSQGGMLAMIVGAHANHLGADDPVAIVSSLTPHAPEVIFTEGVLRNFVDWKALGCASENDAVDRFRELFRMGSVHHLPRPARPETVHLLGAKRDLVVPARSFEQIHQAWPGTHLQWLPGTHLTSLLFHDRNFVSAIARLARTK